MINPCQNKRTKPLVAEATYLYAQLSRYLSSVTVQIERHDVTASWTSSVDRWSSTKIRYPMQKHDLSWTYRVGYFWPDVRTVTNIDFRKKAQKMECEGQNICVSTLKIISATSSIRCGVAKTQNTSCFTLLFTFSSIFHISKTKTIFNISPPFNENEI